MEHLDQRPPTSLRHSCLYECRVAHRRLAPRQHQFEYGLFLAHLDLDELDTLDRSLRLFSRNRRNWYEFRDADHLEHPQAEGPGLKASVTAWLLGQGVTLPESTRIQLVTLPRVAGYVFNPVSFLFVSNADGQPLCAVAEVGNTFGELKPYLIPVANSSSPTPAGSPVRFHCVVPKEYYVSPFSDLDVCFDFRLRAPGERLEIVVNDVTPDGRVLLLSSLVGERRPLTDRELIRLTIRYPLVTLRVITLIHWHALQLWWKRLPWHRKSADPHLQRGVFRPHGSLPAPASAPVPSSSAIPDPTLRAPFSRPLS